MPFECTRAQLIDETSRELHWYLDEGDTCYYIGEYTSHQGFGFSDVNQLILNLKIKPTVQQTNPARYRWKAPAIATVGSCLRESVVSDYLEQHITVVPIPPSKTKAHPEYDDRILRVCHKMVEGIATPDVQDIIVSTVDMDATHLSGPKPKPHELLAIYALECPDDFQPRRITMLVDDVLTTGSHFKACQQFINNHFPDTHVVGFFATRRVFVDPHEDLTVE